MISNLKRKYKSLITFTLSTTFVFFVLNTFNLTYIDSIVISVSIIFIYLLKSNNDAKKKFNSSLNQNLSLKNKLSEFNMKLDDKFKKLDLKLDTFSEKKQQNQSLHGFPAINLSIISSFNKDDTYVIDDMPNNSSDSISHNNVLKRLSALLKKNGQTLKKLKPFNKETFEKISTNSLSEDDNFININFPSNLINSN